MLRYPVKLETDTNGTILVSFPNVPEAHTFGEDREEALARALDALETALMGYMEDRQAIPEPSAFKRKRGPYVALPALSDAKLALYSAMRSGRIKKTELARRLNCHLPQVDRLLDLRHGSRLDQLEAAFRALGKQLSVEILDAA
jgi:antitoxin HicB